MSREPVDDRSLIIRLGLPSDGSRPLWRATAFIKRGRFRNSMPILRRLRSPIFRMELRIDNSNHLARDPLVLNMRIAVGEAAPLFPNLVGCHFDFASALNEFLQVFSH
jgi:hypothetical protein